MSKKQYILLVGLILSLSLFAQPRLQEPEMYVGVQGGIMATTVSFYPTIAHMSPIIRGCTLSPTGGFIFRYSGHKFCGLQVELNYMQRGWREYAAPTDTTAEVNYTRRLHYIELPFLMHLYVGRQACRGFINLGPQIGYCFYDDMGSGIKQTENIRQYDRITHPFDWGVAGGLGMYVNTRKAGTYQVEARFTYSFGTLFANKATDYFSKSHPMNLSIHLAWLWGFHPKKKHR